VLQRTNNFQSATNPKDNLFQKLGLEVWQLFTVLTVIFSLASTFMWIGLLNPRNVADQVNQVDRDKALVYNQYQQDIASLSLLDFSQSVFEADTCSVKIDTDNTVNFNKISKITSESKTKINKVLENINKNTSLSLASINLTKTYSAYIDVLDEIENSTTKLKNFQIKKAEFLNKLLLMCQDQDSQIDKSEVIVAISDIEPLSSNRITTEQLISIKNKISSPDQETQKQMVTYLSEINKVHSTISDVLISIKPKTNQFEIDTKEIEIWERRIKEQNPNIEIKTIFIYDA
jgi:hypothetical protein